MSNPVLLIVDDDDAFLAALQRALQADYTIYAAHSEKEATCLLAPPPDVVLLDLRLDEDDPQNRDGMNVLRVLREQAPHVPVLMITAYGDLDIAVECMKLGAADFMQKPRAQPREIKVRLARALEHSRLSRKITQLEHELHLIEPRQIVGTSLPMQEVKQFVHAISRDANATVLLRGESGTGKELVARSIHASGRRHTAPFVAVTLNALPLTMVESELFGYEPGAFTDAQNRHIGYFEQAHGGVLFLDEIGDVDASVQLKLLRFLEEREFQRLGSTIPIRVNIQIVTATNANLEQRVADGRFREDLYYRLKVHELFLPPLRERGSDIPLLVQHYLRVFNQQGKKVRKITSEALSILQAFTWPGNIRQLKNAVESSIFWAELRGRDIIEVLDLPTDIRSEPVQRAEVNRRVEEDGFDIHEALACDELSYIEEALQITHGKKTGAWKILGYNDRFALRRRVRAILDKYPYLKDEFSHIADDFRTRT